MIRNVERGEPCHPLGWGERVQRWWQVRAGAAGVSFPPAYEQAMEMEKVVAEWCCQCSVIHYVTHGQSFIDS